MTKVHHKRLFAALTAASALIAGMVIPSQAALAEGDTNLALRKTAVASSSEVASLGADKAVDGDKTSKSSRWSTREGSGPEWLYVDLGSTQTVQTIRLYWELRKANDYSIQTLADGSNPQSGEWQTVYHKAGRPPALLDNIVLEHAVQARYVRLYIASYTREDPDGGVSWPTTSIFEMEVYGGEVAPPMSLDTIANQIQVTTPSADDTKLQVSLPKVAGKTVTYNGTDLEQVVDENLNIHKPVVDKTVKVSFKVKDDSTGNYVFREVDVTVPGQNTQTQGDNAAPTVLPELQEWKGRSGTWAPSESTRVYVTNAKLRAAAQAFVDDYATMTGVKLAAPVMRASASMAKPGDIVFVLSTEKNGLDKEGYLLDVTDKVVVTAEQYTGAYWATRTLLQSLKADGNVPQGTARDYPTYSLRGFILDVGRKTFTLDWLKNAAKQMAWYKLNDFQIHLNDNLIPIETLEDPMTGYSAFRLESDVKKGGNNGLNQADLTAKDLWYTKDEFRSFIKESRAMGVDIVPEIDTPAHSLALTKVRPDLRLGTSGRQNDHLNLTSKYDQSAAFVKGIFNEYLQGDNPVFDSETIVHVGADEYNANHEAYRRFADDMLGFVQSSGRTARIWGSLSESRGNTPVRSQHVQMQLWNYGYAHMKDMYDQGFDLINANDGNYYIVPNAGYYYDYLSDDTLYNLAINRISGDFVPAGDKQMIGGAFAVWNDMIDYLDNGVSQYDVWDRIKKPIPLFAAKLWGKESKSLAQAKQIVATMKQAPGVDFDYTASDNEGKLEHYTFADESDASGNNRNLSELTNATLDQVDAKKALHLKGGKSFVQTGLATAGLGNSLRFKVKRMSKSQDEQILFESDYGSIKAVQSGTGKVGFSREGRDYSFAYELPVGVWVDLEIRNEFKMTSLYVNGVKIDTIGDNDKARNRPLLATMMLPVERIGSETAAFDGYVDDVRLGTSKNFASTMPLDNAVMRASKVNAAKPDTKLAELIAAAQPVIDSYDPDAATIEEHTEAINDYLANAEFDKADYSAVNAYVNQIPEDLSIFTDESAQALVRARDSVQPDLPAAMQDTVNAYARELERALSALETKPVVDENYLDPSTMTATANHYQDESSNPNKVLDGDNSTIWHTRWNDANPPHWIQLNLQQPSLVKGVKITPRQSGNNGNLTNYTILVGDNENSLREVKQGTLPNDNSVKTITFDMVTARVVRIRYNKGAGGFGSAAEIRLLTNTNPDTDGLRQEVEKSRAVENKGYTDESWQELQKVIEQAQAMLDAPQKDATRVQELKRQLAKARAGLKLTNVDITPTPESVNKDALRALVEQAKAKKQDAYTSESWAPMAQALADAVVALDSEDTTQKQVDAAASALQEAIDGLKEAPQNPNPGETPDPDENPNPGENPDSKPGEKAISLIRDGKVVAVAAQGSQLTVNASGLPASSDVTITLHSTPILLGIARSDAQGNLSSTVTLPATAEVGEHEIVLESGQTRLSAKLNVTAVSNPTTDDKEPDKKPGKDNSQDKDSKTQNNSNKSKSGKKSKLAKTGVNVAGLSLTVLAMVALAGAVAVVRKRD